MRRRSVLALAALLLLASCTAAGLSVATRGEGRGTVTARTDTGGSASAGATAPGAGGQGRPTPVAATGEPDLAEASGAAEEDGAPTGQVVERTGEAAEDVTMTVTGSTTGLVPGRPGQVLPVVVGNPAGNPAGTVLTVTSVRVVVTGPAGSCPAEDLRVVAVRPRLRVGRGAATTVGLPVELIDRPDRDQSDCAGRAFPLRITATAEVLR